MPTKVGTNAESDQTKAIGKIITLAENNAEVEVIWLYGSRARNNANEDSDYD